MQHIIKLLQMKLRNSLIDSVIPKSISCVSKLGRSTMDNLCHYCKQAASNIQVQHIRPCQSCHLHNRFSCRLRHLSSHLVEDKLRHLDIPRSDFADNSSVNSQHIHLDSFRCKDILKIFMFGISDKKLTFMAFSLISPAVGQTAVIVRVTLSQANNNRLIAPMQTFNFFGFIA